MLLFGRQELFQPFYRIPQIVQHNSLLNTHILVGYSELMYIIIDLSLTLCQGRNKWLGVEDSGASGGGGVLALSLVVRGVG